LTLPFDIRKTFDKALNILGNDMNAPGGIQVKWDGPGHPGGTGNLFIQISECNPLGKH
jgi:hypothetical protein